MRQRRSTKSRIKLFCDRAATHHFPALQHYRLESAPGQIECGDQPVVPATNNDYPLSQRHRQFPACAAAGAGAREALLPEDPPFHSFKITWLAILPGAAMIPPPGCVAEPHMYKFSTGVL